MNKAFKKILERLDAKKQYFQKFYEADGKTEEDEYINKATQLAFDDAKNIVQEVAEEYNGGWIPCSERLPEECTEVLVSVKEMDDSFYTRTSWVQDGVWVIKKTPLQPTVIAWQPLPEPYKERD